MSRSGLSVQQGFFAVAIFCMVVTVVVVGRPVLAPLALACLLAFVLTPIVRALESRGTGRGLAVGLTVSVVLILGAALSTALVTQLSQLAAELPTHSQEFEAKVTRFRETVTFIPESVWETVDGVTGTSSAGLKAEDDEQAQAGFFDRIFGDRYLVIEREESSAWVQFLPLLIAPVLEPLGTVIIAIVLGVFMTAKRDDLRNRLLAILGRARLSQTTQLLSDSSDRLSRYLLGLVAVNLGFAAAFSIGLILVGVPYAALWGCVAFFFRFIPWLGSAVSMLLPLTVSIAVQPGWIPPLAVASLYLFLEFTTGNFIEPWLFGKSVGMNVLAVFVAIIFWTWAWGLIGLLLATPLTLTLVTLGRHFPCFGWLSLLLGDSHALPLHIAFYQRLLAKDDVELTSIITSVQRQRGHAYAMQTLILESMAHADRELRRGGISNAQHRTVSEETGRLAERLIHHAELQTTRAPDAEHEGTQPQVAQLFADQLTPVTPVTVTAFSLGDDRGLQAIRVLFADKPQMEVAIRHQPLTVSLIKTCVQDQTEIVVLSVADRQGRAMLEATCRMLRRCGYDGWIAAGWWRGNGISGRYRRQLKEAGADYVTHRLYAMERMVKYAAQNHTRHRKPVTEVGADPQAPVTLLNA